MPKFITGADDAARTNSDDQSVAAVLNAMTAENWPSLRDHLLGLIQSRAAGCKT
jgi:hypothetical protein